MGTLYLDRRYSRMAIESRRLLLYRGAEEKPHAVPLAMLERVVVVVGSVSVEASALGALGAAGIGVLLLGGRGQDGQRLLIGPGHKDARRRLAQYALHSDAGRKREWAAGLVLAKIAAQERLMRLALTQRPDLRYRLETAAQRLAALRPRLAGDITLDQIRGLEGSAAAAFFEGYAALFPASLRFEGRRRRPPPDPVNACLSLGYTLLHADAELACHRVGLDPLLGMLHEPAYGRASLASDLVEPLRPRVDAMVWRLFSRRELRADQFSHEAAGCRLAKAGRGVFFQAYELHARPWRRYLRRAGHLLCRSLDGADADLDREDSSP